MRFYVPALLLGFSGVLALSPAACAFPEPSRARLGEKIPNLTFKDDRGKTHRLYEMNMRALVIVFLSFECPVSNSYTETLSALARDFERFGVIVWGLTTNPDDTPADIAKSVKEFKLPFPVFKDERLRAARALAADYTPEVFVLDGEFVLQYRGRIDDMYSERLKKHAKISQYNLKQALVELVTERPVSVPATRAVGCRIWREERLIAKEGKVTYYRDVAPILQKSCQHCHRPGAVGPFALLTYQQAVNWSEDIKDYTRRREMPPWLVSEGAPLHHDRRLSAQDIKVLADWHDGGTPPGNPNDAPLPREFPQGWQLGTPDLILTPDEDFLLGPGGMDVTRCFVMPTLQSQDRQVVGIELRPGNPRIVQRVLLFVDTAGIGRRRQKEAQENARINPPLDAHTGKPLLYDRGAGYSDSMANRLGEHPEGVHGWAAGSTPRFLPDGVGMVLPKNADLVVQVHYHRNGRPERDRPQVGLTFARKKIERRYQFVSIIAAPGNESSRFSFSIPPGEDRFKLQGEARGTHDFTLLSLLPQMHLLGKDLAVTMTPPDGPERTLLTIKAWDPIWQEMVFLREPIQVKAGTRFRIEAHYDNSAGNPRNPFSPPRRIPVGEETPSERCLVVLGGHTDTHRPGLPLSPAEDKK